MFGNLKEASVQDRMGFVKKVYSILLVQLAFTAILVAIAINSIDIYYWILLNQWALWVALIAGIVV